MDSDLATLVVGKTGQSRKLTTTIVRSSAWYIHSEAIVVTMFCSQEEEERRFAALKIIAIRGKQEVADTFSRLRTLAYLNTKETILKDLTDWEGTMEPIITSSLSKVQLLELMEKPMEVDIPCHTQRGR